MLCSRSAVSIARPSPEPRFHDYLDVWHPRGTQRYRMTAVRLAVRRSIEMFVYQVGATMSEPSPRTG